MKGTPSPKATYPAHDAGRGDSDVVTAAQLEGKAVHGAAGEVLGRVRHVLLDLGGGRIAFLVIELKGIDRRSLYAIPWIAFGSDPGRAGLVLGHTLEELRGAPSFHADNWPALGDPCWLQAVFGFFAGRAGQAVDV